MPPNENPPEPLDLSKQTLDHLHNTTGDLSSQFVDRTSSSTDLVETDPLRSYLARLSYIQPLPPEQQLQLAVRFHENDDVNAGRMLVITNLRLVVKIANEYQRRWNNLLELIQEGNVGLSEAVTRYDPYRGIKFTSYAQYWIRAMILNFLMNQLHPVKIGSSRAGRKLFFNLKKARKELVEQGIDPTAEAVANLLEVDKNDVIHVAAQLDGPPLFLDAPISSEDAGATFAELIPDTAIPVDEQVAEQQVEHEILQAINRFGNTIVNERDRSIWNDRMLSDDPKSLVQLGLEWDVSKERIRQLETRLRNRFKEFIIAEVGENARIEYLERRLS